jgi:hypothetical protein
LARHFDSLFGEVVKTPSARGRIVSEADRIAGALLEDLGPDGWLHSKVPIGARTAELDVVILVDGVPRAVAAELFERYGSVLETIPARWVVTISDPLDLGKNPASRFFDQHLRLGKLSVRDALGIITSRLDVDELTARQYIEGIAVEKFTPRDLISVLRQSVLQPSESSKDISRRRAELEAKVHRLGRPAAMLVAEMQGRGGPVSASDELLLNRMGWGRSRASEILNLLHREGLATASEQASPAGGRPRRVYELVDGLQP